MVLEVYISGNMRVDYKERMKVDRTAVVNAIKEDPTLNLPKMPDRFG